MRIVRLQSSPPLSLHLTAKLTIILSVHPDHRHHLKEDFGFGVDEFAAAPVPAGSLQVQAVDKHSFCWGLGDVVLHPPGHLVAQHHPVQGPALVGPRDLLRVQMGTLRHRCGQFDTAVRTDDRDDIWQQFPPRKINCDKRAVIKVQQKKNHTRAVKCTPSKVLLREVLQRWKENKSNMTQKKKKGAARATNK